jgi:hypothetical protein
MRVVDAVALTIAAAILTMVAPGDAHAGFFNEISEGFGEGNWRTEVTVATGFHSGRRSRSGDMLYMGNIEYEFPIYARATLGLKAYPLFAYDQSDDDLDTLAGAGLGLGARYYFGEDERTDWFGEVTAAALGHSGNINGNSSNFNFMIGAGLGYEFQNDWHVTAQFHHISNSGIGENNAGANTIGLAVGYKF